MGERVTFQVHNSETGEYGPIIYLHRGGEMAESVILRFKKLWENNYDKIRSDVGFTTGLIVSTCQYVTGKVRIWNASELSDGEFPGDYGAVLLDVATGKVRCLHGHLEEFSDD